MIIQHLGTGKPRGCNVGEFVAICDLVHYVETIHDLCYLLTASGNIS